MAQTPPPEVAALPPAPSSSNPVPFSGLMDAFLAALAGFRTGMIALTTNCYNNTVDAYNNTLAAQDSAVGAAASAASAAASAAVIKWLSGTSYEEGANVFSPLNFLTYRRMVAGGGTIDPSVDTANWVNFVASARDRTGRNLIVNGSCQIDQINNGAVITPINSDYVIDNCKYYSSIASRITAQRVFTKSWVIRCTVLSSYVPISSDYFIVKWLVDGLNIKQLLWGTVNAKPVSLQFLATASVAGAYSGSVANMDGSRAYPFLFTLGANITTLVKIEGIPGDSAGAWLTTAQASLSVGFDLGCGELIKGAPNNWAFNNWAGVTGTTSLVAQPNGSTLEIGNVQLEVGSVCTQFENKYYKDDLIDCQWSYCTGTVQIIGNAYTPNAFVGSRVYFPVTMKSAPTIGMTLIRQQNTYGSPLITEVTADGFGAYQQATSTTPIAESVGRYIADARG